MTRNKLAVIGNPISHSLSPGMHNPALKFLGLDYYYSSLKVEKNEFEDFIKKAVDEYVGFNVTVPYKSYILPYLDIVDDEALLSQSVNTVIVESSGKLRGKSTDGFGLEMALNQTFGVNPSDVSLCFIGCGGAAKASAVHFLENGVRNVFFVNRTIANAESFSQRLFQKYPKSNIECCCLSDLKRIKKFLEFNPIVIQSTSLGLNNTDLSPFPESLFRDGLRVFDMIYHKTAFLHMAEKKNCLFADGRLMLLYQGALSFELWTGLKPPIETMKDALYKQLCR